MKYIIFEDKHGALKPIMFPETVDHWVMKEALRGLMVPVSAGFVSYQNGLPVCSGGSEGLNLVSNEVDAARIHLGPSVEMMPDQLVMTLWSAYKVRLAK